MQTNPPLTSKPGRIAAGTLATASVLLLAGFLLHPDESPDTATTATSIAASANQWALAHWLLAAGGLLLAAAALAVARYAPSRGARLAWTAVAVSAVLALEIFVLEATVAVRLGVAKDVAGLENLLPIEIPGIVGLFGLNAAGLLVFVGIARSAVTLPGRLASALAALAAATGLAGDFAFLAGNAALANLQDATALYIIGLAAIGVRGALRRSQPMPSTQTAARMG